MNKTLQLISIFLAFASTGCLKEPEVAQVTSAASFFEGAVSVNNIGGALRIQWGQPTQTVQAFNIYSVDKNGKKTLIGKAEPGKTSFTDADVKLGTVYSYNVKAVDARGIEDANEKIVRGFIFSGILNATVAGYNSAQIGIPSDLGAFDRLRIYGVPSGGEKKLLAEVSPGTTLVTLNNLRSGTTYTFSVQAYNSTIAREDGNNATVTDQTFSYSFTSSASDLRYQGIVNAKAYGLAPGAPTGTPSVRKVMIQYNPFKFSLSSTKYKIVRVAKGGAVDMQTTSICTSGSDASCIPTDGIVQCDKFTLPSICEDINLAAPPKKYDYVIGQYMMDGTTAYIEESPLTSLSPSFRTTVAIPPDNMVLLKREAANYEMCTLMGRAVDPLNNMRCNYKSWGAAPYNKGLVGVAESPLGLSDSYYDFGYDLFVDRWEAACNWTLKGAGSPGAALGVPGDVYLTTNSWNECYLKDSTGTWRQLATSAPANEVYKIYTNDPSARGGYRPPMGQVAQNRADNICRNIIDPDYGKKRLPRMREFRAYAAWPTFAEPNYITPALLDSYYEPGGQSNSHTEGFHCNSNNAMGMTFDSSGASVGQPGYNLSGGYMKVFNIGSVETKNCVSRYGVQDHIGNQAEYVSDIAVCNYDASSTCRGVSSTFDSGNTDFNNFYFDNSINGGPTNASYINWAMPDLSKHSYFSLPLGLPMMGPDSGYSVGVDRGMLLGDAFEMAPARLYSNNSQVVSRSVHVGGRFSSGNGSGRWATSIFVGRDNFDGPTGFRCVLPIP